MEVFILVLVLALIVGGMTVMLTAAYVSTEEERERLAHAPRADAASKATRLVSIPPGFFEPSRASTPIAFVFDDGLVHRLEAHLRTEQALVEQFVHQPSIDNLYRQPGAPLQLH